MLPRLSLTDRSCSNHRLMRKHDRPFTLYDTLGFAIFYRIHNGGCENKGYDAGCTCTHVDARLDERTTHHALLYTLSFLRPYTRDLKCHTIYSALPIDVTRHARLRLKKITSLHEDIDHRISIFIRAWHSQRMKLFRVAHVAFEIFDRWRHNVKCEKTM